MGDVGCGREKSVDGSEAWIRLGLMDQKRRLTITVAKQIRLHDFELKTLSKMKISRITKVLALLMLMAGWDGVVGAGGKDGGAAGVPKEIGVPREDVPQDTPPTGLPDTSVGVPSVAAAPVEEPTAAPLGPAPQPDPMPEPVATGGGSSGGSSGPGTLDAGEWFDDELPEYFQPMDADDLDFDSWFMRYRQTLRQVLLAGKDSTRTAFVHLVRRIDDATVRDALLTDMIRWACRRRRYRAHQTLKNEIAREYDEFVTYWTSRGLPLAAVKSLWSATSEQLELHWKAAIRVAEEGFRDNAHDGTGGTGEPIGGPLPGGLPLATLLRKRRKRKRKARRSSTQKAAKTGKDGDSDSGDSSGTTTDGSEDEKGFGKDEDWGEDGGGKPAAKP